MLFASSGLGVDQIGVLFALYPGVWGIGQLFTGALSDRWGRKGVLTTGMLTQAIALVVIALPGTFIVWAVGTILLGSGNRHGVPTLLTSIHGSES